MTIEQKETKRNQSIKEKNRTPVSFVDERGQEALRVPLDDHGNRFAIVSPHDYRGLMAAGVSGVWCTNDNGQGRRYVRCQCPTATGRKATLLQVARLIVGAGPGEIVKHHNGDTLDLRWANLWTMRGKAKREDYALARAAEATRRHISGTNAA